MAWLCGAASGFSMLACEGKSVESYKFRLEKGKRLYFEPLHYSLLVALKFIHILLEFLDLRLGRVLLLLRSLDGSLHLVDGPLELCYCAPI
jgi:hypothetical protein